jgi:hypothetical protein
VRGFRRRYVVLFSLIAIMFLGYTVAAQAEMVIVNDTADTYVDTRQPTRNYGRDKLLFSQFDSGNDRRASVFFKFDLSSIPHGSTISEATIRVYLRDMTGQKTVNIGVYRATSDWSEWETTWQNKPVGPGPVTSNLISQTPGYKSFDATALVNGWLNSSYPDFGLFLASKSKSSYIVTFNSREASANQPQMVIYYSPPSTGSIAPVTDLGMASGRAPVISNVSTKDIANGNATIEWTTDSVTTSKVRYGLSFAYDQTATFGEEALRHSMTLHELDPGRTYHYRISGRNKAGMETVSKDYTFRTPAAPKQEDNTGTNRWGWLALVGMALLAMLLFVGTVVAVFEFPRWRRGELDLKNLRETWRFKLRG